MYLTAVARSLATVPRIALLCYFAIFIHRIGYVCVVGCSAVEWSVFFADIFFFICLFVCIFCFSI